MSAVNLRKQTRTGSSCVISGERNRVTELAGSSESNSAGLAAPADLGDGLKIPDRGHSISADARGTHRTRSLRARLLRQNFITSNIRDADTRRRSW